ncbi:GPI-anchored protein [Salix suchowensis]|nr:GPI-anchored protein [Salix suchowensis]
MASIKIKIFFPFLLFHAMFLLSSATVMRCGGGEDNLLENINSYRTSLLGLPALTKNKKASCLAREIADTLWNPCTTDDGPAEFPTTDFAILPICIPGNDEQTPVNFQNYSRSQYEKYANESSYSGAGVGAGENWMVIVFVENNKSWSSAGGGKHSLVSGFGFGHGSVSLLLGLLLSYHLVL